MRWSVCKRDGHWRVYQGDAVWNDTFDTLADAHTWATQCAVADRVYEPGGLTTFAAMSRLYDLICNMLDSYSKEVCSH